jgi:hypothetical protein
MPLLAQVCLDEGDLFRVASGERQIFECLGIHREERRRRAVLRRHVRDAGTLRCCELGHARSCDLDEGADDLCLAEQLADRKGTVHAGDAIAQLALEPELDDFRHEHRDRLAKRCRLCLDAADAPAHAADAIDRGRVGVRADKRIEARHLPLALPERIGADDLREALHVELVADALCRGTTFTFSKERLAHFRKAKRSRLRSASMRSFSARAPAHPASSAITEWSMMRVVGIWGFTFSGSPPRAAIASRMAAKSTKTGTPVKSWKRTLDGMNSISLPWAPFSPASRMRAHMSMASSSVLARRTTFSRRIRSARGSLSAPGIFDTMVAAREMPPASICLGFLASRTAADTASVLSICDLGLLHDVCKTSFMFDAFIRNGGTGGQRERVPALLH